MIWRTLTNQAHSEVPDVHSWDTRLILQRTNCSTAAGLFWQDVHFPLPCTRLTQGPTHPIRFSITARFCNLGLFLILCKPTIALGPRIFSFEGVASIYIMHPLINFMLVSRPSATFQGSVFQPLCGFCKRNSKKGIIPRISHHVKQVKHRQGVVHKLRKTRCQILGQIELHCVSKNLTHDSMHQITQRAQISIFFCWQKRGRLVEEGDHEACRDCQKDQDQQLTDSRLPSTRLWRKNVYSFGLIMLA